MSNLFRICSPDSFVRLGKEVYVWRSVDFVPQVCIYSYIRLLHIADTALRQLYDSRGQCVISYKREPMSIDLRSAGPRAFVSIAPEIANDPVLRDIAVASLFLFKFCREVAMPWQKKKGLPLPLPTLLWSSEAPVAPTAVKQEETQAPVSVEEKVTTEETRKTTDGLGDYARVPEAEAVKA